METRARRLPCRLLAPRRLAQAAALAALVLTPTGCSAPARSGPRPESVDPGRVPAPPRAGGLPAWVGRAQGWDRLTEIEAWLRTDGATADDFWVLEGHLQLAEGRLALSQARSASADGRVSLAREGFERVLKAGVASEAQLFRARRGLEAAGGERRAELTARAAGLPAGVQPRASWGARRAEPRRMDRSRAAWRYITVHHSAMAGEGALSGSLDESRRAIQRIQGAHMGAEGYGDIGYHFLVDPAGRVFEGRELAFQGAHSGGRNNVGNIGICMLGNFDTGRPTRAAIAALDELIARLRRQYRIDARDVRGHRDWKNTDCPGRYLAAYLEKYE